MTRDELLAAIDAADDWLLVDDELCESLGVTRRWVRALIARLEDDGTVESRYTNDRAGRCVRAEVRRVT